MAPRSITEIAKRFASKTNFEIEHIHEPNPADGGISILRNYRRPGKTHGKPFTRSEPRLRLHLVRQVGSGPNTGLWGEFTILAKKGKFPTHRQSNVIAHPDGTVTLKANNLTHKELAFALRHVMTLQRAMQ